MPKNQRIIEKYIGINEESKSQIWERVEKITDLKKDDKIRIYEDKLAQEDNKPIIEGYIIKVPNDKEFNITELEIETLNNRELRIKREKSIIENFKSHKPKHN